jgi:uncharacterized membrane protein
VDAVVEFLLKYRPAAFARGSFAFDPVLPVWVVLGVAVCVMGVSLWSLTRAASGLRGVRRAALGVVRVGAIGVLAWALCRPVLVVAESVARRNVVAVVVDDSRSMRIADVDGRSRGSVVQSLVGSADSALARALAARFQVRVYRTSDATRIADANRVAFDGARSRVLDAIGRVQDALADAPVSGVVVLTDGADNDVRGEGTRSTADRLAALRARGVPVYPVGIGSAPFATDVEIAAVTAPRHALRNATLLLDVTLTHRGVGGAPLPLIVEDSGRIVVTTTVRLARDAAATPVRVRVPLRETGARLLTVRVPVQAGELLGENNVRTLLVTVRDRREKVLYVEGEPRPELKFARRAVDGDKQLQLVTLLRSARDKYLRLGVDDSLELMQGFPTSRAQLFGYRALVLGSIEASFFTGEQLRMIADFVGERGGGLLLLGGRDAYGDGGYAGTVLEDVVPVAMEQRPRTAAAPVTLVSAVATAEGLRHPALQVATTDSLVARRWRTLPQLTTVNLLARPKAGATVLLQGRTGDGSETRPLLVAQRYGRGRVLALGAQDDWRWQMHEAIAVEDSTHELLWRQMLRWLVHDVPDRVEIIADDELVPGDAVQARVIVRDSAYGRRADATVTGTLVDTSGVPQAFSLDRATDADSEYVGTVVPAARGVHELRVRAALGKDSVTASQYLRVADPSAELFSAERRDLLLEQLARETGGRVYTPARAVEVARDLVYSTAGTTSVERRDLWDAPVVLLALLGLLGGEWVLRRRWGLA